MTVKTYRDLMTDVEDSCDICIIGTGCGGATLGVRLAEAGKKVIFLERGGYYTAKDFDQREDHMIAKIDGGRGFDTSDDGAIALTYGNNVGGASVHYWADSYRTPLDRLKLWQDQYGLEGHTQKDLAPHWDILEPDLNIHEAEDRYYNPMNRLLKKGAQKLGWQGHPIPQARKPCAGSGYCVQGCAYDFKQSQLVTHLPRALQAGATVYADTEASQLVWQGTRLKKIHARVLNRATGRPNGRAVKITAKIFVLAAGGYGSPVFLLRNGFKENLPAVGEYTHCNPSPMVHARFEEDIIQYRNIPAAWAITEFRLARMDGGKYLEGGYSFVANQLQPAMLSALLPGLGGSHRKLMAGLKKLGGTICWIDDAEFGHVRLSGDQPKFHVPLSGTNGAIISDSLKKQSRLLLEVGAKEVLFGDVSDTRITELSQIDAAVQNISITPSRLVLASPHPSGGARMGKNPENSVVGFDHRVHGTDNFYVADPSVFPTSPSVDPSLTIMGFSCIAAQHIRRALD